MERAIRHSPTLVVLDMGRSPVTGESAVAGLQAVYAKPIPILMSSADGHAPEKAKRLADFAYLVKPFDLDDLRALVRLGLSLS
jgi:DNA-binding response OmpR family regulator